MAREAVGARCSSPGRIRNRTEERSVHNAGFTTAKRRWREKKKKEKERRSRTRRRLQNSMDPCGTLFVSPSGSSHRFLLCISRDRHGASDAGKMGHANKMQRRKIVDTLTLGYLR